MTSKPTLTFGYDDDGIDATATFETEQPLDLVPASEQIGSCSPVLNVTGSSYVTCEAWESTDSIAIAYGQEGIADDFLLYRRPDLAERLECVARSGSYTTVIKHEGGSPVKTTYQYVIDLPQQPDDIVKPKKAPKGWNKEDRHGDEITWAECFGGDLLLALGFTEVE